MPSSPEETGDWTGTQPFSAPFKYGFNSFQGKEVCVAKNRTGGPGWGLRATQHKGLSIFWGAVRKPLVVFENSKNISDCLVHLLVNQEGEGIYINFKYEPSPAA